MTLHAVVHDTIVFERRFPVVPEKVYAAWSDAAQRARWHFPGDGWELAEFDQDFRVGGHERSRFGPKGAPHLREEGRFLDIVPNERIVSAGTMHEDELRISITLCTVELAADGDGTLLKLTDQSAFLDGREIAEGLRANGFTHVETGLIRGSVHYVVQDQPEAVADLIERYASLHSK